jgi:hypothetical protein
MEPSKELIQQLQREEIEDARRMTLAAKFWAGAELFDYACTIARAGIRADHPSFNEDQVMDELRRRIALGRRIEARP